MGKCRMGKCRMGKCRMGKCRMGEMPCGGMPHEVGVAGWVPSIHQVTLCISHKGPEAFIKEFLVMPYGGPKQLLVLLSNSWYFPKGPQASVVAAVQAQGRWLVKT